MQAIDTVIFDLDGTLVRYHGVDFESSWGAVARAAGTLERSRQLLEYYFPRKDAYAEWVQEEVNLLRDVPVAEVASQVLPAPYAAGVREAVDRLRERFTLGILSSGVSLVADWVRDDLDLAFAYANRLEIENDRFTGGSEMVVDLWSKADALRNLAEARCFDLARVCFVGDHLNDLPVMEIVALSIAANPKDERVRSAADHVIEDFCELAPILERYNEMA